MPVVLSSTDADEDSREEEAEEERAANRGAWERNMLLPVGQLQGRAPAPQPVERVQRARSRF